MKIINQHKLIYFLAIVKFIIPFILVSSFYELHRDEYLYLAEAKHLAWGYMEVPPMLPFLGWIANLFGETMFWVKLWPGLFGAATFIITAKIVTDLGGKTISIVLCFLPFILTGYIRLFYLFHPNFLDTFFWTLMAFAVFKFIRTNQNKWLYLLGFSAGLGMMSKYSTAFYLMSILVGLLITQHRTIFLNKHLYIGGLIGLCIFLPNIFWQYNHNLPLIAHMQELQEEQLQYNTPINFIIGQFLMLLPFLFLWLIGLYFVSFSKEGKPYQTFGWAYILVISILIILHGKNYYSLGVYPILFAFGSYQFEQLRFKHLNWVKYIPLGLGILLSIYIYPLLLPIAEPAELSNYYQKAKLNKSGDFIWEDQQEHELPQDYADMIGWEDLASKTAKAYHSLSKEQQTKTLIYCRGYFSAGALNYYAKKFDLPEVYSDNASFLGWMPKKYAINNLILVGKNMPDSTDLVFTLFKNKRIVDSSGVPYFRERKMKIILFENGKDSLNTAIEQGIKQLKQRFHL